MSDAQGSGAIARKPSAPRSSATRQGHTLKNTYNYHYVNHIGYDKFEQQNYIKYCNGVETTHQYDPQRRRLDQLQVVSTKTRNTQLMNNQYTYDAVSNVLSVANHAPLPAQANALGGQMHHQYTYDGLYRLTQATGTYTGTNNKTAAYQLNMKYDNLHNIISKQQHIKQTNVQYNGSLYAGYDLSYTYDVNKPHQITNIKDHNYRTEKAEDKDNKTKNQQQYQYDANGNLIYVNTTKQMPDSQQRAISKERKLLWDEENHLEALDDNGFISNYWYDASGERTIKLSGGNEGIYVNSLFSGGSTDNTNFTLYVNPYIVVSQGGRYTKHIYIGSKRIVSKLGDMDSYGADPRRIDYAGTHVNKVNIDYKNKYHTAQQVIKDRFAQFQVEYQGKDNYDIPVSVAILIRKIRLKVEISAMATITQKSYSITTTVIIWVVPV